MNIKNDIKVMGAFKSIVNGLYLLISVIRIIAVVFLILQTVLLITQNRGSIAAFDNIKLK